MSVIYHNNVCFRNLIKLNNCFIGLNQQEVDFLFVAKSKARSFKKTKQVFALLIQQSYCPFSVWCQ